MKTEKVLNITEGAQLLVLGDIGLKGTQLLADKGQQQLLNRYSEDFVEAASRLYGKAPDTDRLRQFVQDCPYVEVDKGGIFKALWDISVEYRIGFEVDIFDIPVSQKTIELCNFFDINPYEMLSKKCILAIVTGGRQLIRRLFENGINAAIIGEVVKGNDKLIIHQDGSLYLRPAKQDSIEGFLNRKDNFHE